MTLDREGFLCRLVVSKRLNLVTFKLGGKRAYRLKAGGFGVDAVPGWPVYLAQEKGFLAKEGIQLDFVRSHHK